MKILVIEDEPQMLENIARSLKQEQYVVETAIDFDSALAKAEVYEYDCILLDISIPGGNGLRILENLKKLIGLKALSSFLQRILLMIKWQGCTWEQTTICPSPSISPNCTPALPPC